MPRDRNIFAWTSPRALAPEYISVNYPFDSSGGGDHTSTETIEVTVRAPAPKPDGVCGPTAMIQLDRKQARELGMALIMATNGQHRHRLGR